MVETIKRLFSPPIYPEDENKTRIAHLMHIILLALLVLFSFNTAISYLFGDEALAIAINAGTVLAAVGLFALLHSGRVRLSAIITVSLFWAVVTLVSFFVSGFTIIIVSSYFVLVFLAGTVVNKRAGILFAFLSIAAAILTYIIEAAGYMLAALPVIPTIAVSATAVNLLAMAVILYLNLQNLENALERLQKSQKKWPTRRPNWKIASPNAPVTWRSQTKSGAASPRFAMSTPYSPAPWKLSSLTSIFTTPKFTWSTRPKTS